MARAWIASCFLAGDAGTRSFPAQAAIWAADPETALAHLVDHLRAEDLALLWLDDLSPGEGALAEQVGAHHLVKIGSDARSGQAVLDCRTIDGLAPLDSQPETWPPKTVPEALQADLFGQPVPTAAEIAHYGADSPPLKTFLVADTPQFPDWDDLVQDLTLPHASLFSGETATQMSGVAPSLVELAEGDDFSRRLFTFLDRMPEASQAHHWHRPIGIFLRSREPFDVVRAHLRRFTKLEDEDGTWFFNRFWDTRQALVSLPFLAAEATIAARLFGMTAGRKAPVLSLLAALDGRAGRFVSARWTGDGLGEPPASRSQPLDGPYRDLLGRAAARVSMAKTVDYLARTVVAPPPRAEIENLVVALGPTFERLGVVSELGRTRVALIAAHLGLDCLNDPRFAAAGLSADRIGHDSQGEKVFVIGREIAARMRALARPSAPAPRATPATDTSAEAVLRGVRRFDPTADWSWGEAPLTAWAERLVWQFSSHPRHANCFPCHVAVAYFFGMKFLMDPMLPFGRALNGRTGKDYDETLQMISSDLLSGATHG